MFSGDYFRECNALKEYCAKINHSNLEIAKHFDQTFLKFDGSRIRFCGLNSRVKMSSITGLRPVDPENPVRV